MLVATLSNKVSFNEYLQVYSKVMFLSQKWHCVYPTIPDCNIIQQPKPVTLL